MEASRICRSLVSISLFSERPVQTCGSIINTQNLFRAVRYVVQLGAFLIHLPHHSTHSKEKGIKWKNKPKESPWRSTMQPLALSLTFTEETPWNLQLQCKEMSRNIDTALCFYTTASDKQLLGTTPKVKWKIFWLFHSLWSALQRRQTTFLQKMLCQCIPIKNPAHKFHPDKVIQLL